MKRSMIISNGYGRYESPNELSNNLRLRIFRELGNFSKITNVHRIIA